MNIETITKMKKKEKKNNQNENKEQSFTIFITYNESSTNKPELIDELVIRHEHKSFLF